jgi:hypothetical protein
MNALYKKNRYRLKWASAAFATLASLVGLFLLVSRYEFHALVHSGVYRILLVLLTAALFSNFLSSALVRFISIYPAWKASA